jgi:hypothetical protein
MEDRDEDSELLTLGAGCRIAQGRELLGRRRREPRLPIARDAQGIEAGLGELPQDGTGLTRGVVHGADDELRRRRLRRRRLYRTRRRRSAGRRRLGLVSAAARGEQGEHEQCHEAAKHRGYASRR